MYKITKRQKDNAERLNVIIKPSKNPKNKLVRSFARPL